MLTGHFFKHLKWRRLIAGRIDKTGRRAYVQHVCDQIVNQFAELSHLTVVAAPVDLRSTEDIEEPARPLEHIECIRFVKTDYCRESWQLHLAELAHQPETHWHKCDYGRLCAIVPLVFHTHCLALFKLACPTSVAESEFESHVKLLDTLVHCASATEAPTLGRLFPLRQPVAIPNDRRFSDQEGSKSPARSPSHPQVLKALEYVEHSLSNPKLTVSHVADVLGIHPDYLASLFRKEVGQRMSRYIATRRVEFAQNLLSTTNWTVKRVAREAGFANSKWFYHVFQTHTGLTPSAYRRKASA